jgi:hypothetical protein
MDLALCAGTQGHVHAAWPSSVAYMQIGGLHSGNRGCGWPSRNAVKGIDLPSREPTAGAHAA